MILIRQRLVNLVESGLLPVVGLAAGIVKHAVSLHVEAVLGVLTYWVLVVDEGP